VDTISLGVHFRNDPDFGDLIELRQGAPVVQRNRP